MQHLTIATLLSVNKVLCNLYLFETSFFFQFGCCILLAAILFEETTGFFVVFFTEIHSMQG